MKFKIYKHNMKNLKFNVTIIFITIITLCELFVLGFIISSILLWIGYGIWRAFKDKIVEIKDY